MKPALSWLLVGAGAAAVITASRLQHAPPTASVPDWIPPDAVVVVKIADAEGLAAKGTLAFEWLGPAVDVIGAKLVGLALGSPWPAWLFFVPDPFAKLAYDFGKTQNDPFAAAQGVLAAGLQDMLAHLRSAGMDTRRPQFWFGFLRPGALARFEQAQAAGQDPPRESPVDWVLGIPTQRGQRLDLDKLLAAGRPESSGPPLQWSTFLHEGTTFASLDAAVLERVKHQIMSRGPSSFRARLSASARKFFAEHDLAFFMREPYQVSSPGASSPTAENWFGPLTKLADQLDALGLGFSLTQAGIIGTIYAGCRGDSPVGRALTGRRFQRHRLAFALPENTRTVAQTSLDPALGRALAEAAGIDPALAKSLPEASAFSIAPPSATGLLDALTGELSTPLPVLVTGVMSARDAADYRARREQAAGLMLSVVRIFTPQGDQPSAHINEGAGQIEGLRLDRIGVRIPSLAGRQNPGRPAPLPGLEELSLVSAWDGNRVAGFGMGIGVTRQVKETLDAIAATEPRLGDTPGFQLAWRHAPEQPLFFVAGPFMSPGEDFAAQLSKIVLSLGGAAPASRSTGASNRPEVLMLALGAEADALTLRAYVSDTMCREAARSMARGATMLLGIGKLFLLGG
jgi:hypothetical protein